ncbi:protein kinase [Nocardia sp. NPDC005978]|uniref:serine/threonine-protein kinase n=1 Tax=Nocardia sp. NPDC005978 TaxID=3156725 RepID=UPI0033BE52A3
MLRSGERFAGYLIERELGRGGMGAVYLAQHPRLPRRTALKLLNRDLFGDTETRARFEREADLVARLEHPHIVPIYDRGSDGDQLWISMRYIDGPDASTLDSAKLAPAQAVRIIAATAQALDYAHRKGVLHRDVKPANILLEHDDGEDRVFLADFGIARLRDDSAARLTQTGSFTATLAYAAPEQLIGSDLDHRCDQYSLACTLFRLLTGDVPFTAEHPVAIMQGHLNQPPPRVSALRAGLPPALDAVLARAMAKSPADRFDSCIEFATAAQRALEGGRPGSGFAGASHAGHGLPGTGPGNGRPGTPQAGNGLPGTGPGNGAPGTQHAGNGVPGASHRANGNGHAGNGHAGGAHAGGGHPRPAAGFQGTPAPGFASAQPTPPPRGVISVPSQPVAARPGTTPFPGAARPQAGAGVPPGGAASGPAPRPATRKFGASSAAIPVPDNRTRAAGTGPSTRLPGARPGPGWGRQPVKKRRKSRTRGCLLWLLVLTVAVLLLVGGCVAAVDRFLPLRTGTTPSTVVPTTEYEAPSEPTNVWEPTYETTSDAPLPEGSIVPIP